MSRTVLFTTEKKSRGAGKGAREVSSIARTAYPHFRRFVDKPDATHYIAVEEL